MWPACGSARGVRRSHFLPHSALGPGIDPSYVFSAGSRRCARSLPAATGSSRSARSRASGTISPRRRPGAPSSRGARSARTDGGRRGLVRALVLGLDLPLCCGSCRAGGRFRALASPRHSRPRSLVRTALAALAILLVAQVSRARVAAGSTTRARETWAPLVAALLAGSAVAAGVFPSPELSGLGVKASSTSPPATARRWSRVIFRYCALSLLVTCGALVRRAAAVGKVAWWTLLTVPVALAFRHASPTMILLAPGRSRLALLAADGMSALLLALSCGAFALRTRGHEIDDRRVAAVRGRPRLASARAPSAIGLDAERLSSERLPASPHHCARCRVDVVPYALSLIAANELSEQRERVRRRARSQGGDALCFAARSRGGLVHFGQVDRRNPFWDTPATWRSILADYRFEGVALGLRRRAQPDVGCSTRSGSGWRFHRCLPDSLSCSPRSRQCRRSAVACARWS